MSEAARPAGQPGGATTASAGAPVASAPGPQDAAPEAPPVNPIVARLREKVGDGIERDEVIGGQLVVRVARERIVDVCQILRDESSLGFDHLADVTAVDYLSYNPDGGPLGEGRTPRYDVVYHLYSIQHNHRVRLKVALDEDDATVASVTGVWKTALFGEREVYDMYGITFSGHPDLSRILMPEDWQGHPLRKDFPLIEEEIEFTTTLSRLNEVRRSEPRGGPHGS